MSGDEETIEQLSMFAQIEITTHTSEPVGTSSNIKQKKEKAAKLKPQKDQVTTPVEDSSEPKEKSPMQSVEKGIDFEASLNQLETVVKELDGEVKLEQALKLFEEGIKLSMECEKFIKCAEQKIEILKKQADGSMQPESFENETAKLLAGD